MTEAGTSEHHVAVIGAGRMGRPMIDRMIAAGYRPTILARRPETQADADAHGLRWAATIADAVRDADVVLTVVFDEAQLRLAVLGPDGALASMRPGSVLVQHTTCDPDTVVQLAAAARVRRVRFLDAAVSGNPRDIEAGQLTVWVGGDENTLNEVRPVLGAYASPIMPVGPVGSGQRIKLVNNAMFVAQVGLAVDAVRLGNALGFSEETLINALQAGSGASRAMGSVGWIGADAVGARLSEFMLKDIAAVRALAERDQAELGLIGAVLDSRVVQSQVLCDGVPPSRDLGARSRSAPGSVKGT
jgi:3-hydroxyisobutyrate dehydrogenase-like beta-hydroxyacid dehydrogenase